MARRSPRAPLPPASAPSDMASAPAFPFSHRPLASAHSSVSGETADEAQVQAHVAKSKTLFSRLFRLRSRSPSSGVDASGPPLTGERGAQVQGQPQPQSQSHAPVTSLFRSLHLRGKSSSSDDRGSNEASATDSGRPDSVLMASALTKVAPHRYWHSKVGFVGRSVATLHSG